MRLKILCEDRCEDIAVNLAAACVRSLRRSDQLRSLSESHHVHYMIDVYIVLLYKLKRTQDIFAQVSIDRRNIRLRLSRASIFARSFARKYVIKATNLLIVNETLTDYFKSKK